MKPGFSAQQVEQAAKKIQAIFDQNNIPAVAGQMEGAGECRSIMILSEQPLPKSLGIGSTFDGVPVGLSVVESIDRFKKAPPSSKSKPQP